MLRLVCRHRIRAAGLGCRRDEGPRGAALAEVAGRGCRGDNATGKSRQVDHGHPHGRTPHNGTHGTHSLEWRLWSLRPALWRSLRQGLLNLRPSLRWSNRRSLGRCRRLAFAGTLKLPSGRRQSCCGAAWLQRHRCRRRAILGRSACSRPWGRLGRFGRRGHRWASRCGDTRSLQGLHRLPPFGESFHLCLERKFPLFKVSHFCPKFISPFRRSFFALSLRPACQDLRLKVADHVLEFIQLRPLFAWQAANVDLRSSLFGLARNSVEAIPRVPCCRGRVSSSNARRWSCVKRGALDLLLLRGNSLPRSLWRFLRLGHLGRLGRSRRRRLPGLSCRNCRISLERRVGFLAHLDRSWRKSASRLCHACKNPSSTSRQRHRSSWPCLSTDFCGLIRRPSLPQRRAARGIGARDSGRPGRKGGRRGDAKAWLCSPADDSLSRC
mmetsp:Transcript_32907/g.71803  ORF Transcript_32907/g.71803 Transcript_32907/m.71803 type:complete len:439 (+) Transcript_32907:432-1748(+)